MNHFHRGHEWLLYYDTTSSPVGKILVAISDQGLFLVHYPLKIPAQRLLKRYTAPPWLFHPIRSQARTAQARRQLRLYFQGKLRRFTLPLDLCGTPFQVHVWKELRKIPFGRTTTYGELAKRIGQPRAVRAVGMANNRNKLGIVVPCHRVIGSNGHLTGYAAGLGIKSKLIRHESEVAKGRRHV